MRLKPRSLVEEAEQRGLPEEEHLAALERVALGEKRVRYIAEELEKTQNPDNPKVIAAAEARADQRLREEGALAEYNKLQSEAEARARLEPQEGTVAWLEKSVIEATDLHSEVVEKFGPDSTQAKDSLDTINYFAKKLAQARGKEAKAETVPKDVAPERNTEALEALAKARWELLESDEGAEADTTAKRTELLNQFHELAEEQGIPYGRERDEILFKDAPSYISRPWGSTPLGKIEVDETAKEEPAAKEEPPPTEPAPKGVTSHWDLLSQESQKMAARLVEKGATDEQLDKFINKPSETAHKKRAHSTKGLMQTKRCVILTQIFTQGLRLGTT